MPALKIARQERFAQFVAKGLPASKAYAEAGYKPSDAHASRLARNGKVQARIAELQGRAAKRAEIEVAEVLQLYTELARFDVSDVVTWKGNKATIKASSELPPEVRRCISEVREVVDAKGRRTLSIKFHSKPEALKAIGQHLGMFKHTVEHTGSLGAGEFWDRVSAAKAKKREREKR